MCKNCTHRSELCYVQMNRQILHIMFQLSSQDGARVKVGGSFPGGTFSLNKRCAPVQSLRRKSRRELCSISNAKSTASANDNGNDDGTTSANNEKNNPSSLHMDKDIPTTFKRGMRGLGKVLTRIREWWSERLPSKARDPSKILDVNGNYILAVQSASRQGKGRHKELLDIKAITHLQPLPTLLTLYTRTLWKWPTVPKPMCYCWQCHRYYCGRAMPTFGGSSGRKRFGTMPVRSPTDCNDTWPRIVYLLGEKID